jgi:hypothetical protein
VTSFTVYVESSAVLAWLMGEPRGSEVASIMARADRIVTSQLTLVECERALMRSWALHWISEVERVDRSRGLVQASERWTQLRVDEEAMERARRPFPVEPVRALDALHLVSALTARGKAPNLLFLTLDQRISENAERLGFDVLPAATARKRP